MFSATEYYIYNPADGPKSYSIAKKQISLLNDSTNHQTIQKIIKATDANKSIPKVNILDVMEMVTLCWEDLTEETVKKCFIKFRISSKDQANTHNNLDDPFIELRSNMEKLKSLGVNVIPEELTPEEFANFDDTVVATELTLSDQSILAMVMKSRSQTKQRVMKRMATMLGKKNRRKSQGKRSLQANSQGQRLARRTTISDSIFAGFNLALIF